MDKSGQQFDEYLKAYQAGQVDQGAKKMLDDVLLWLRRKVEKPSPRRSSSTSSAGKKRKRVEEEEEQSQPDVVIAPSHLPFFSFPTPPAFDVFSSPSTSFTSADQSFTLPDFDFDFTLPDFSFAPLPVQMEMPNGTCASQASNGTGMDWNMDLDLGKWMST